MGELTIEGAKNLLIRNDVTEYKVKLIVADKINDLALIQIDDEKFNNFSAIPYIIDFNLASVGEPIFSLGYPLRSSMGEEIKLTNGIVSSKTGFQGDVNAYTLSIPIQPGNSGGPIFNSDGLIIGIVNSKHSDAENVSYAIKSGYLQNLTELLDEQIQFSKTNMLVGKNLSEQVKIAKDYVYIVEAQ